MFPDGTVQHQYAANIIAENMLSQVDEEGFSYDILDYIVDHQKDGTAMARADGYTTYTSGKRSLKKTVKGW